jgi:hypothetical protein
MPDYLNGFEILGTPKTVRLNMQFKGEQFSAPLEVYVSALVAAMRDDQRAIFFQFLKSLAASHDRTTAQRAEKARVVADIPMPRIE